MIKLSKMQKRIMDLVEKITYLDDKDLLARNIPLSAAEALCEKGILISVYGLGYTKVSKVNER